MSGQRNVVRGGSNRERMSNAEAASAGGNRANVNNPRRGSEDRPSSNSSGQSNRSVVDVTPLRMILSDGQEIVPGSFSEARRDVSVTTPSTAPIPSTVQFTSSRPPVNRSIVINEGAIPPRSLPVAFGKGKKVLVDDFPPKIPRDRTRTRPFADRKSVV